MKQKRALPMANVVIASPCDVPWDVMVGDNRVRHCLECKRDVHNLSAMTSAEVEAFLEAADAMGARGEHKPCVSLFQRTDGTILTSDCPVGVRRRRLRSLIASTMGVGLASLMAFTALALLKGDELRQVIHHERPQISYATRPAKATAPGHVRIDGTAGAEVFEDGKHVGTVPMAMPVTPGAHVYTFKHGGASQAQTIVVHENELANLHVTFEKKPIVPDRPMMAGKMVRPIRGEMRKGGI